MAGSFESCYWASLLLLERNHQVIFGFTTYHPRGGFSGKYSVPRDIVVSENGEFEVELKIQDYSRFKTSNPASSVTVRIQN